MRIVFEGIDGSGKTTQSKLFHEYLLGQGICSIWTKEPTDYPIGKMIREQFDQQVLSNEVIELLFVADRFDHHDTLIDDADCMIVQDRGVMSWRAYSKLDKYTYYFLNHIQKKFNPDLTVYLDSSVEKVASVVQKRGEEFDADYLEEVLERYDELLAEEKNVISVVPTSITETHQKIVEQFEAWLLR